MNMCVHVYSLPSSFLPLSSFLSLSISLSLSFSPCFSLSHFLSFSSLPPSLPLFPQIKLAYTGSNHYDGVWGEIDERVYGFCQSKKWAWLDHNDTNHNNCQVVRISFCIPKVHAFFDSFSRESEHETTQVPTRPCLGASMRFYFFKNILSGKLSQHYIVIVHVVEAMLVFASVYVCLYSTCNSIFS